VWQVLPCVVLQVCAVGVCEGVCLYAVLFAVCVLLINKNKHLAHNLNGFDYMGIIFGLCADYIIYYLSPPLGDNRDNFDAFFKPKKGKSPYLEDPPHQNFRPLVF
jgi:hypothetical protein